MNQSPPQFEGLIPSVPGTCLWGIFLIDRKVEEGPAHCGWCYPWAGGAGLHNKEAKQEPQKQARAPLFFVVSVPKENFPTFYSTR